MDATSKKETTENEDSANAISKTRENVNLTDQPSGERAVFFWNFVKNQLDEERKSLRDKRNLVR